MIHESFISKDAAFGKSPSLRHHHLNLVKFVEGLFYHVLWIDTVLQRYAGLSFQKYYASNRNCKCTVHLIVTGNSVVDLAEESHVYPNMDPRHRLASTRSTTIICVHQCKAFSFGHELSMEIIVTENVDM